MSTEEAEYHEIHALSLSEISPRADGSSACNVVWTIAAVNATPHTVPMERIKYTVAAETAWSVQESASSVSYKLSHNAHFIPE